MLLRIALLCLISLLSTPTMAQFNGLSGIYSLNSMTFGIMPTFTLVTPGTGYISGDTVTLDCPDTTIFISAGASRPVATYTSGTWTLTSPGVGTYIPSTGDPTQKNGTCLLTQFATSGSGTGLTIQATFGFIGANTNFPRIITPTNFNCIGNGIADDTACIQSTINAAEASGWPLYFDSLHLYNITSTLNITTPIDIEGAYRFGFWTTTPNNQRYCPWGLTSTANINIINASAVTGTIRNLCIQAGPSGGSGTSASSGAAIKVAPPSTTTYSTGWHLEGNTLLNVYDGISLDGAGYSGICCGSGTTADGITVWRNTIINPADVGISIGKNTAGAATVGITVSDNAIGCINAASKASGIGLAVYDGGLQYDGTLNGPEGCNIGVAVIPGSVSGHGQQAQIIAHGTMGDQSKTHDLLIQPSNSSGEVAFSEFDNVWASGTLNNPSDQEVLISIANGGSIYNTTFMGGTFHSLQNQSVPVFDIEGGSGNGIINLILNGLSIDCWGGSTFCGTGLKINSIASGDLQHFNINARIGQFGSAKFTTGLSINTDPGAFDIAVNGSTINATTGIALTTPVSGNSSVLTIVGNGLWDTTTPISYTPNPLDIVTIVNNAGVDSACVTVSVSSNSITLPNANNCEVISTGGTPNITNIGPPWKNRQITLQSAATGGFTTSFDGSQTYPICRSTTVAQSQIITLLWRAGGTCWSPSL